jgi:S1-C subfamily serine protease
MISNSEFEHEPTKPAISNKLIITVVLLSAMCGTVGGAIGATYSLRSRNIAAPITVQQGLYKEESAVIDVVRKTSPAVVSVVISRDLNTLPGFGFGRLEQLPNIQQVGAGTGFFVTSNGLLLTNRHVVADERANYTVVTNDGKTYEARVLARDPVNDLAILQVEIKDAPILPLADSSQLQIGQQVVAIGNSLGQYQNTVTSGIVSGIGRSITAGGRDGSEQLEGVIQTDAAINPGNSGGPLLNLAGQVIGINTAIDQEGQLVGFAIPANDAQRALESYDKTGKIVRPFLGIRYTTITKALAGQQSLPRDYGALILRGSTADDFAVLPGSPADRAGLVENDIILEINGNKITENNTLSRQLKNYKAGDALLLKVFHRSEEKEVRLTLGESS